MSLMIMVHLKQMISYHLPVIKKAASLDSSIKIVTKILSLARSAESEYNCTKKLVNIKQEKKNCDL